MTKKISILFIVVCLILTTGIAGCGKKPTTGPGDKQAGPLQSEDLGGEGEEGPPAGGKNQFPVAEAGQDKEAEAGQVIEFDGSASADPDGQISVYSWDFGDGGMAEGAKASHSYSEPGAYSVLLTVIDSQGARGTDTCQVVILAKEIVYKNENFGFQLTLPADWEGYKVEDKPGTFEEGEAPCRTIGFQLPTEETKFYPTGYADICWLQIYTKAQWQKVEASDNPYIAHTPKISEGKTYVFAYLCAQDAPPDLMDKTGSNQWHDIIKTFELIGVPKIKPPVDLVNQEEFYQLLDSAISQSKAEPGTSYQFIWNFKKNDLIKRNKVEERGGNILAVSASARDVWQESGVNQDLKVLVDVKGYVSADCTSATYCIIRLTKAPLSGAVSINPQD